MNNQLLAKKLCKHYIKAGQRIDVLDQIDLRVQSRESLAIMGQSGSGKSTLLHVLGALLKPSSGEVCLNDQSFEKLNSNQLSLLRLKEFGFVFQFHHLLGDLTAIENVTMPLRIANHNEQDALKQALGILEHLGLSNRIHHKPSELSGGEQQRVAIARAMVARPKFIFADEPTGNLDSKHAMDVCEMLFNVVHTMNAGLILVTHSLTIAQKASKQMVLENGKLSYV